MLAEQALGANLSTQTMSIDGQHQLNTIDADLLSLVMRLSESLQRTILGSAGVRQAVLEVLSTQGNTHDQTVNNVPRDQNRLVLEFVQGLLNELA